MIAQLTGTIVDVRPGHIVLDVHGVGYLIAVRASSGFVIGDTSTLRTHLAVRENALDLYGFQHLDELSLFAELIKLPKIGPKSALQILSQADIPVIQKAVIDQDATYLTKMSGIGKKTAEKIVSELKDVFDGYAFTVDKSLSSGDTDVVDALVSLGYAQKDARDAVQKIPAEITDTKARITFALKIVQ